MRDLTLLLLLAFFAKQGFADCYENLSQGKDSTSHQILSSEIEADDSSHEGPEKKALKRLMRDLNCQDVLISEFTCKNIVPQLRDSKVCYARSELGYFIINKDYLGNVNLIFNRLD